MEILTNAESKKILGGTQNLNIINANINSMQIVTIIEEDVQIVNFTGNDLEE